MANLLQWLAQEFPRGKRQNFKQMVEQGRVLINDRAARKLSQEVGEGDRVRVLPREEVRHAERKVPIHPLKVVYEDEDLLVVDKPAGLLTSTVPGERRATALAIVRAYVAAREPKARVGLIHRLDKDASGLLVFSKSHRAYESLKTQFFKHSVERIYEAVVSGVPSGKKGTIDSRLIERADGTVRSTGEHAKGQRAVTEYEVVRANKDGTAVLRVRLLTGRKHQIRVQLSEKGFAIVGDAVYGVADKVGLRLRAVELSLEHPKTRERMTFAARAK